MYTEILSQKNLGFSKRKVAQNLGLNFRTVSRYWEMDADTFQCTIQNRQRRRNLELYEGIVADWLRKYPGLSASQVLDWLEQHYQVKVSERTARRFVKRVRERYNIPKMQEPTRQYAAVEDPPMGHQMQVDFGIVHVMDVRSRSYRKLYCLAGVLSNSRYKWGHWFTTPPTTQQLVSALEECFEYLGGMPQELVFDQDRLLAVDENYGDVIYTYEFEKFRQRMGLSVYLCRTGDPESKGRVEAVVKYFKRHFARYRRFSEIDVWEDEFLAWLARTGNARVHGTTKKIPAEVFQQEQLFLKTGTIHEKNPQPHCNKAGSQGQYGFLPGLPLHPAPRHLLPGREVVLEAVDGRLRILDSIGRVVLAEHPLSSEKGRLIRNSNHGRDYRQSLDTAQQALLKLLGDTSRAQTFLMHIRQLKGRYVRDQFQAIEQAVREWDDPTAVEQALAYCIENSLYSATDFRDAIAFFAKAQEAEMTTIAANPKVHILPLVRIQKRSLTEYATLLKGGDA